MVFACTPRGVLNTCYRCRNRMRTCKCFEVRAPPLAGPGPSQSRRSNRASPPTVSLTCGSTGEQDSILQNRINENTDRMCEMMASSFSVSRAGSRLGTRGRPVSSTSNRPQSAMSSSEKGFDHRVQSGRPLSAMSHSANRQVPVGLGWSEPGDGTRGGACEVLDDSDQAKPIFPKHNFGESHYKASFSLSATKWGGRRDQLHKQEPVGPSSFKPKQFRPASASSRQSRQPDEMSQCSERSVGSHKGVSQQRVDFLLRQLRLLCYRKVKGNGSDVSVREVFRHFDSNKDEDEDGAGIDSHEFYSALNKLMLGTPEDGLVIEEEAKSFPSKSTCVVTRVSVDTCTISL